VIVNLTAGQQGSSLFLFPIPNSQSSFPFQNFEGKHAATPFRPTARQLMHIGSKSKGQEPANRNLALWRSISNTEAAGLS